MAQKVEDSTVISIKHSHVFEVDIEQRLNLKGKGKGDFVEGENFSPFPGSVFRLKILIKDNSRFIISLTNCGKESVKILNFEVKYNSTKKSEKKNFCLLPDGMMDLPDFFFKHYRMVPWAYFTCTLELEIGNCIGILIELKCSVLSFTFTWGPFK